MRPTDYPFDLNYLTACWTEYMQSGSVAMTVDGQVPFELDPIVLASWRRCRARLDPHDASRPVYQSPAARHAVLAQRTDLISLALPFLEDICDFSAEQNLVVYLADRSGCILAVESRDTGHVLAQRIGLGVGRYWSEDQAGTGAIALALTTAMPVQVVGPEHYVRRLHAVAMAAAPIHDANGRVIGAVGVACPLEDTSARDLSLVMSAARAITNQLQADSLVEETLQQLTQVNAILDVVADGIIMWDQQGRVNHCNQQAAALFGVVTTRLLGVAWDALLVWPDDLRTTIVENSEVQRFESTLIIENRRINCFVTLRPILGGNDQSLGYVALFRPIRQVRRLVHEQVGTDATFKLDDLSSQASQMQHVLRQARVAARASIPVLLVGESGVGKTYVAQAIHNAGPRARRPFLSINCRAIPRELMLAELLGVERSDSRVGRPSKFELADGGTLMLNQLQHLTLEMQSALLEVIDRRHIMRLGGTRPVLLNVRIIATLSPSPEEFVANGTLIPELYYRLSVFHLTIPPLRERMVDFPLLLQRNIDRLSADGYTVKINPQTQAIFDRYPWPGNVRELESVLERALAQSPTGELLPEHLPEALRTNRVLLTSSPLLKPVISIDEAEREAIMRAGAVCHGVVTQMAQELGIGRTTLWRKMKHLNISPSQFK